MTRSLVFRDQSKLSPRYVPMELLYREKQLSFLTSLYRTILEDVSKCQMQVCQLIGPVGTGKTSTALRFAGDLEKSAVKKGLNIEHVYLNGKLDGSSRFTLYRSMLDKAAPGSATRSLSPEEMLRRLIKRLRENNQYVVITVDEIKCFLQKSKEHLVYDLTRLNELTLGEPSPILGVIFIDRDLSFHRYLDESEKSTLGRIVVSFPRYTGEQIRDILDARVRVAFKPGGIEEEALTYVSDVTAKPPINGDLRVSLDLLLYAGLLAEQQGHKSIELDHARKVHGETHPGITTEDILYMNDNERLVLWGLIRALRTKKTVYVSLEDIRQDYSAVCEEQSVEPVQEIEPYIQDLIYQRIMDMKSLTEFGISGVSTEDLERFLNMIVQKLKRGLDEFKKET